MSTAHILGFPRIGANRELKFALEGYWKGTHDQKTLLEVAKTEEENVWRAQADLDLLTVGDFSLYDHVLDTSVLLGVVPPRFNHPHGETVSLDTYFRIARGQAPTGEDAPASEMTKWFDTNYHYIVPEIEKSQAFTLSHERLFDAVTRAKSFSDKPVKAVLLGPVTWLYLAREKGESFDKLSLLPELISAYEKIITRLNEVGASWIQIDEPILVLDLESTWLNAFKTVYESLGKVSDNLILTTYFDQLAGNIESIKTLPVAGLHLDGVRGDLENVAGHWPTDKILSLGIVDGRNVWANALEKSLDTLESLAKKWGEKLWIGSSCSLLHVPVDLDAEVKLNREVKDWLAFGIQKIAEIVTLDRGINAGREAISAELERSRNREEARRTSTKIHNDAVVRRVALIKKGDDQRNAPFEARAQIQADRFNLPLFPTTTIGSFPQTNEIRQIRRQFRLGNVDESAYREGILAQIKYAISEQEKLGLDVLVHGEAERNDMVEYFGEHLDGFAFTQYGWVQSYGSRCVKPPIIYGDISRPSSITVDWIQYAQSLTDKPVKGMLTGPVTILSWSFPRDDERDEISAYQIALALRDEVVELEASGVGIIQIDEPAIRELLPLRKDRQTAYLNWAEKAFRLTASGVKNETQIHTHMCYSNFNEIIHSIANLDADVITIETSRSDMKLLDVFRDFKYPNDIGPGVYDIHSPRIPTVSEIETLIEHATEYLPKERIWINPDCGLKTRGWEEVRRALNNLVAATESLRKKYVA